MKTNSFLLLLFITISAFAASPLRAADSSIITLEDELPFQFSGSSDWGTYTLTTSQDWSNATVYLGYQFFGNYDRTIAGTTQTPAVLSSSQAVFGNEADYNNVTLTGAGTLWTNSSYLYVGRKGAYNNLTISSGAGMSTQYAYIGKMWFKNSDQTAYSADSNTLTVTGAGSTLSVSAALYVGEAGSNNSLVVANGGTVTNNAAAIGDATEATSNNATVDGAGSTWTTKYELVVGNSVVGSTLTVTHGGTVSSGSFSVSKSLGSKNNSVLVSGSGSTLSVGGSLIVGVAGSNNQMSIADGGKLVSGTSSIGSTSLGYTTTNNTVLVTGEGSTWTAQDLTIYSGNSLTVRNGGLMKITASLTLESGAYIELDEGYLAWHGDQGLTFQSLIEAGNFQGLDSSGQWVTVTDPGLFNIAFATTSEESGTLTDGLYTDLAGYTVLSVAETDALAASPFSALRISAMGVPEPTTWALLLLGGLLSLAQFVSPRKLSLFWDRRGIAMTFFEKYLGACSRQTRRIK